MGAGMAERIARQVGRAAFLRGTLHGLRVIWPILSVLLMAKAGLGVAVALAEGWGPVDGIYFAFVTGLTIGYGDLAPSGPLTKMLAVAIGLTGVVFTGLVVAVAVAALQQAAGPAGRALRRGLGQAKGG